MVFSESLRFISLRFNTAYTFLKVYDNYLFTDKNKTQPTLDPLVFTQ